MVKRINTVKGMIVQLYVSGVSDYKSVSAFLHFMSKSLVIQLNFQKINRVNLMLFIRGTATVRSILKINFKIGNYPKDNYHRLDYDGFYFI